MSAASTTNLVGTISLSVAATGFVVLEAAHYMGFLEGPAWTVVRAGFEAGLIGGIADAFAVSALFRQVPRGRFALPHTDIIVRNRHKITEGVVDFVENQLLSPSSVQEKLREFSLSDVLFGQLATREGRELAASILITLAEHAARELEDERLRRFLTDLLREQIRKLNLPPLFASWLEARVTSGDTRLLWQTLAAALADHADRGGFDEVMMELLQKVLDTYREEPEGVLGRIKGWTVSWMINPDKDSKKLRRLVSKQLHEIAGAESHLMMDKLDKIVSRYARNLRKGKDEAIEPVRQFQESLAAHPDLEGIVGHMLTDIRRLAEKRLQGDKLELHVALADVIERGITKLQSDADAKSRLDRWARESLGSIVTRHHHLIGATARESLNRLDDRELVAQLETKVGKDLQYIRLNGAVIGSLVGIVLMTMKLLLGSS